MGEHTGSEQELADLLRHAAPQQLPLATFDHASVLAASRRVGRRRQRLVAGGVTAVGVLLASGAVAVLGRGPVQETVASSGGTASSSAATAHVPAEGVAPPSAQPVPTPGATGMGPQLQGSGPCGPADRTVHAALVGVFPEVAAQQPFAVDQQCAPGTTGVGVVLAVVGRVEVLVGPAAAPSSGPTGTASTADGRTVTVVPVPAAGSPTGLDAATLDEVARRVAAALG